MTTSRYSNARGPVDLRFRLLAGLLFLGHVCVDVSGQCYLIGDMNCAVCWVTPAGATAP